MQRLAGGSPASRAWAGSTWPYGVRQEAKRWFGHEASGRPLPRSDSQFALDNELYHA